MRAIDSDALKEYIKKADLTAVERSALLQAISNLAHPHPAERPLTLKELREMDDEPVWCCPKNDSAKGSWMIVGPNGCENITSFAIYDDYGTGWLAYRRPPEVSP